MADLYLSRKLAVSSPPASASEGPNWMPSTPITLGSKIRKSSREASIATFQGENNVEELEMLLEVIIIFDLIFLRYLN